MKTITVSLYNRPKYTKIVLDSLKSCFGIEDYSIAICCDPGSKEVEKMAKEFLPNQTEVIVNNRRLGCNTNIYQCLAIGFSKNDYHIHFEDDTVPGKDCLKYFEWARNKSSDSNLLTVCGYVTSDNKTEHYYPKNNTIENVSRRCWFTPWGWATWKDRFEEMESVWDFQGKNGSWDTTINHTVRKDRWELFPTVSRIQNIGGEMVTHVPNNEWHKQHHYNEYWIESIKNYQENFVEGV